MRYDSQAWLPHVEGMTAELRTSLPEFANLEYPCLWLIQLLWEG